MLSARYWVGGSLASRPPRLRLGCVAYGWTPRDEAVWDLRHAPHLLVSGRTGSGKSTALRTLLAGFPTVGERWRVVVLDPKGGLDWGDLAHLVHLATSPVEVATTCAWLGDILDDHAGLLRMAGARSWFDYVRTRPRPVIPLFPTVVVVDEAVDCFGGLGLAKADATTVVEGLGRIIRQGRALGVHTLLSVLRPDAAALGTHGGLLREQLGARLALGPLTDDSRRMLRLDADPPGLRSGAGFGVAVGMDRRTERQATAVRVARLDDDLAVTRLGLLTAPAVTGPPPTGRQPVDP